MTGATEHHTYTIAITRSSAPQAPCRHLYTLGVSLAARWRASRWSFGSPLPLRHRRRPDRDFFVFWQLQRTMMPPFPALERAGTPSLDMWAAL